MQGCMYLTLREDMFCMNEEMNEQTNEGINERTDEWTTDSMTE